MANNITTSTGPVSQSIAAEKDSRVKQEREYYLRNKDGDKVGGNFTIPKGDFSHFLGYKPATKAEKSGDEQPSGSRVIELALQKEMNSLGEGAAKHGMEFRNWYAAWGGYENQPGREKDLIKSGIDAFNNSMEKDSDLNLTKSSTMGNSNYFEQLEKYQKSSSETNVRYLEMQYKFDQASKSHGMISNLMKVRHEAISRAIHESR